MSLAELSIDEFLARLAAQTPTPGGGSVAALTGALAAGLGQMVAAYTLGRPKFAAVAPQVQALAERLHRARQHLRQLMDEDATAYGGLNAALALDKSDPQRATRVQEAAWVAGAVPLETAGFCAKVADAVKTLQEFGNPLLRADMEAARHLAQAGLRAAAANVRANLPLMSPESAQAVEKQLSPLLAVGGVV